MPNDLEVLSWAGLAVAVANGHSDVRAASDLITDTNDNDGVPAPWVDWDFSAQTRD